MTAYLKRMLTNHPRSCLALLGLGSILLSGTCDVALDNLPLYPARVNAMPIYLAMLCELSNTCLMAEKWIFSVGGVCLILVAISPFIRRA